MHIFNWNQWSRIPRHIAWPRTQYSQWQSLHSLQWALEEIQEAESDDLHFQMRSMHTVFKCITIIFLLCLFKTLFIYHGIV